jgi:hypothetical protein
MARKRFLSPDFFTSLSLAQMSVETAMTFAGLWIYADDYGRAEDDVEMVKATIWPRRREQTPRRIGEYLDTLAAAGMICRYTVAGYPLLHIRSWREYQNPSHPTPSKLAPCPEHEPEAWECFAIESDHAREKFRKDARVAPEALASGSRSSRETFANDSDTDLYGLDRDLYSPSMNGSPTARARKIMDGPRS